MTAFDKLSDRLEGTFVAPEWLVHELIAKILERPLTIEDECGRSFLGTPLSAKQFWELVEGMPRAPKRTVSMAFYTRRDYESDGNNPFLDDYRTSHIDPRKYLVHYDNDEGQENTMTLVWTACVPKTPHCGTHVCRRFVTTDRVPSFSEPLSEDEVFALPSETVVLVNPYTTPHAPPSKHDFDSFRKRAFFTIDVPLE